jgi:hypothetical protein
VPEQQHDRRGHDQRRGCRRSQARGRLCRGAQLYAVCQEATSSTELPLDSESQARKYEPNQRPTSQPSPVKTLKARKFSTTRNRGACHSAQTNQNALAVRSHPEPWQEAVSEEPAPAQLLAEPVDQQHVHRDQRKR